ncbi:unnamed protein product [Phytomonas sp. EM1]|nr:unnamed protein product [Phytomonas sp. EM1]|eukprot:CCW65089.1 unnamed protein product [Phytomonas sp. isolate EM1]
MDFPNSNISTLTRLSQPKLLSRNDHSLPPAATTEVLYPTSVTLAAQVVDRLRWWRTQRISEHPFPLDHYVFNDCYVNYFPFGKRLLSSQVRAALRRARRVLANQKVSLFPAPVLSEGSRVSRSHTQRPGGGRGQEVPPQDSPSADPGRLLSEGAPGDAQAGGRTHTSDRNGRHAPQESYGRSRETPVGAPHYPHHDHRDRPLTSSLSEVHDGERTPNNKRCAPNGDGAIAPIVEPRQGERASATFRTESAACGSPLQSKRNHPGKTGRGEAPCAPFLCSCTSQPTYVGGNHHLSHNGRLDCQAFNKREVHRAMTLLRLYSRRAASAPLRRDWLLKDSFSFSGDHLSMDTSRTTSFRRYLLASQGDASSRAPHLRDHEPTRGGADSVNSRFPSSSARQREKAVVLHHPPRLVIFNRDMAASQAIQVAEVTSLDVKGNRLLADSAEVLDLGSMPLFSYECHFYREQLRHPASPLPVAVPDHPGDGLASPLRPSIRSSFREQPRVHHRLSLRASSVPSLPRLVCGKGLFRARSRRTTRSHCYAPYNAPLSPCKAPDNGSSQMSLYKRVSNLQDFYVFNPLVDCIGAGSFSKVYAAVPILRGPATHAWRLTLSGEGLGCSHTRNQRAEVYAAASPVLRGLPAPSVSEMSVAVKVIACNDFALADGARNHDEQLHSISSYHDPKCEDTNDVSAVAARIKCRIKLVEVEREISILRRLNHSGCSRFYEALRTPDELLIAMQLHPGSMNLRQYLEHFGPPPEAYTALMIYQLMETLQYLHNVFGLIHRDIKLENLLASLIPESPEDICEVIGAEGSRSDSTFRTPHPKHAATPKAEGRSNIGISGGSSPSVDMNDARPVRGATADAVSMLRLTLIDFGLARRTTRRPSHVSTDKRHFAGVPSTHANHPLSGILDAAETTRSLVHEGMPSPMPSTNLLCPLLEAEGIDEEEEEGEGETEEGEAYSTEMDASETSSAESSSSSSSDGVESAEAGEGLVGVGEVIDPKPPSVATGHSLSDSNPLKANKGALASVRLNEECLDMTPNVSREAATIDGHLSSVSGSCTHGKDPKERACPKGEDSTAPFESPSGVSSTSYSTFPLHRDGATCRDVDKPPRGDAEDHGHGNLVSNGSRNLQSVDRRGLADTSTIKAQGAPGCSALAPSIEVPLSACEEVSIRAAAIARSGNHFPLEGSATLLLTPCGTEKYLAPEMTDWILRHSWSHRPTSVAMAKQLDTYAVGIVTYVLLSGCFPFNATTRATLLEQQRHVPRCNSTRWKTVSEQGIAFVQALLEPDPSKRMTAKEALEHPFLREAAHHARRLNLVPRPDYPTERDPPMRTAYESGTSLAATENRGRGRYPTVRRPSQVASTNSPSPASMLHTAATRPLPHPVDHPKTAGSLTSPRDLSSQRLEIVLSSAATLSASPLHPSRGSPFLPSSASAPPRNPLPGAPPPSPLSDDRDATGLLIERHSRPASTATDPLWQAGAKVVGSAPPPLSRHPVHTDQGPSPAMLVPEKEKEKEREVCVCPTMGVRSPGHPPLRSPFALPGSSLDEVPVPEVGGRSIHSGEPQDGTSDNSDLFDQLYNNIMSGM